VSLFLPARQRRCAAYRACSRYPIKTIRLVTGHMLDVDPAQAVRGPQYVVKKGKTLVLTAGETSELLDRSRPFSILTRQPLIARVRVECLKPTDYER
jgi:hypothetical protein